MLVIEKIDGRNIIAPTKTYIGDAGWDVVSLEHKVLQPGEHYQFKLGFRIIGEKGKVYITHARSSMAIKQGLDVLGDIIDNGYRGEVSIVLQNSLSCGDVEIKAGDKIGQILVQNVDDDCKLTMNGITIEKILCERLDNAYGSTGK